ncbi:MAG: hypothetical protein ACFFA0_11730 [Promethearchaeota archaeon]
MKHIDTKFTADFIPNDESSIKLKNKEELKKVPEKIPEKILKFY